ncbi:MAG: GGDEF domain-containing protein, partial [Deltaproteobacteria bacterium]|nr:GGDEF domain-containing protein [Deltaproteobacteria bacterium]
MFLKNKKLNKSLKIKIISRIIILLVVLFVIIDIIFALSFRQESIGEAKIRSKTIAKVVRDGLTSLMVMGVIQNRKIFIQRLKRASKQVDIQDISIIRGNSVNKQFGPGFKSEKPTTADEKYVLASGKKLEKLDETFNSVRYRVIIPYKATSTGVVDCLICHKVKSGTVLGAISLTMNLTSVRVATFWTIVQTSIIFLAFLIILVLAFFKFLSPYISLFQKIESGLENLKDGEMDAALIDEKGLPEDEAGKVAKTLNETSKSLKEILSDINSKVSTLIGYTVLKTDNYLKDTIKIINELVRIYNFKRVIEKDRTKKDIIKRIESIIRDYMCFENYAIYEVGDNNKMSILAVGSKINLGKDDMWCDRSSLEDADACRAKRTGGDVDSVNFPCICPNFKFNVPEEDESGTGKTCNEKYNYYCVPIYIGGKVGMVLQLIFDSDVADFVHWMIPYIKGYLAEASPVIESRKLMELLKEQSIVDQLTGLYNRRYLDDSSENIVAGIKRRGTNLGILMLDIDHFKEVNDKYGHDNGDIVLKSVAKHIRKSIRSSDIAIRFGGEEFIALLIDIRQGEGLEIAEKIRKAVESSPLEIPGGVVLKKTISIGVCEFPADTEKFWQAVKYADVAMYEAKENG